MAGIAFTYDPASKVGQVRLLTCDTAAEGLNKAGGDRTRTDAEVTQFLVQNGNDVRAAAASLLESRAAEYAQAATLIEEGHLRQDVRARCGQCLAAAQALRKTVGSPALVAARPAVFTGEERW